MKIEKILIYGSSSLAEKTINVLEKEYDLVGHVPSENPVIAGKVDLPVVDESIEHDIKLSLQYNKRIDNIENAFKDELSEILKEKVEYRLGTRNQTNNALQEIRKGIIQHGDLGTIKL